MLCCGFFGVLLFGLVWFGVVLVIVKWEKTCSLLFKYSAFKNCTNF